MPRKARELSQSGVTVTEQNSPLAGLSGLTNLEQATRCTPSGPRALCPCSSTRVHQLTYTYLKVAYAHSVLQEDDDLSPFTIMADRILVLLCAM